jgi:ribosomal-protein-alanine N-acetyltransferase
LDDAVPTEMNSFSRWPAMKALRTSIRRIVPAGWTQRKLDMPALETERLVLRKFGRADLKDIIAWGETSAASYKEKEAREFLDYCFREYRERGIGPWAMQLKENNAIVGNCGFPHIVFQERCGEVNYYVAPAHRRHGFAFEALQALLQFGFGEAGLTRIQARCDLDNLGSERVMQKAEMKFERVVEPIPDSKDPIPPQKMYVILRTHFISLQSGERGPSPP